MTVIRLSVAVVLVTGIGACNSTAATPWKAGAAKVSITPERSLWLAGYAVRTKPSEGVGQNLYATALVLEDRKHRRVVLITADLLRVTRAMSRNVAARLTKQYGIRRDHILFNASHTHSGPVMSEIPSNYYPVDREFWAEVDNYTRELEDKLVAVVGVAISDLKPARLSFGKTEATFGHNRRTQFGNGPVDHEVQILRVDDHRGKLRAVVFGYACHPTTIAKGSEFYQFHGDWPGVTKERLETRYPGAVAMFVAGCGGDINPYPRGTIELAQQHGAALATAIGSALEDSFRPVRGTPRCAMEEVPLTFAPTPSREELTARLQDKSAEARRYAQTLLKILDRDGKLPVEYPIPIQIWQFGSDLTLIALGGEVVVDYCLRLKKELSAEKLWVAAYSNDVFAYVPSLRVLREGGYEGGAGMVYTTHPSPFASTIEETIIGKIHQLLRQMGK